MSLIDMKPRQETRLRVFLQRPGALATRASSLNALRVETATCSPAHGKTTESGVCSGIPAATILTFAGEGHAQKRTPLSGGAWARWGGRSRFFVGERRAALLSRAPALDR